jgi:hypothetical protein
MGMYTFWEKLEPTCHTGKARLALQVRPALQVQPALPGAATPTPWHVSSPIHLLSRGQNLNERDRPRKRQFDRMDEVSITWIYGSTCPANQPPQPSFQGNPKRPWAKAVHHTAWSKAGRTSQLSYRAKIDPRNRPSTTSGVVIRSVQGERWWITGPAAPLDLAAPMILSPRAQLTSLSYKRHFTFARMDTQHWRISFPIFCSLRFDSS